MDLSNQESVHTYAQFTCPEMQLNTFVTHHITYYLGILVIKGPGVSFIKMCAEQSLTLRGRTCRQWTLVNPTRSKWLCLYLAGRIYIMKHRPKLPYMVNNFPLISRLTIEKSEVVQINVHLTLLGVVYLGNNC